MTKENGLKILDLYCHRMGKWTEVPWCPGLFSYNQQLGADQTKTPISPEGQSLLGLICPGYQGQFEHSVQFSSVAQSCLTLRPKEQHVRPPCPSPTLGVYTNPCPLSQWCHPTISSSVIPFSSCPQSFPASGSFPMSQLFASGGQSIGVSASASVLPMNIQHWFRLGLTSCISLQSKGLSRVFSNTTVRDSKRDTDVYIEQSFGLGERERVGWFRRMALKRV